MKIVMWVGNDPNQIALANKFHNLFPLAGIVTETKKGKRRFTIGKIIEKVTEKLKLPVIAQSWFGMLHFYQAGYPEWPETKLIRVENINSDKTLAFTNNLQPDLILVSGTRLIKEKLLSLKPSIGILNLHTGLSPYIKGGPNCTNWCIATNQFHMIGNSVMWINKGIDSGNLIATELSNFNGDESLTAVHIKVMEHGHSLYMRSVGFLAEGKRQDVPQDSIGKGVTYYTRQWGLKEKKDLVSNFRSFSEIIRSDEYSHAKSSVKTVKLF